MISAPGSVRNLEETDHNIQNYFKLTIFHKFEHSSMPIRSQYKIKISGHELDKNNKK